MKKSLYLLLLTPLLLSGCGKQPASSYLDKDATFCICSDVSNEVRALDLLVNCGVISSYETKQDGTPINLPFRISLIDESLLVSALPDYDYGVLPCNTALTGRLVADTSLPSESDEVADLRANVLACRTAGLSDPEYANKIAVLTEALLQKETADFIQTKYSGVVKSEQADLRSDKIASKAGNGVIKVCASEVPHKEILTSSAVTDYVSEKGYRLEVTVLDWTLQNEAVEKGDYDANYFQHRPYLATYNGTENKVSAACKVHFEPLRIYRGRGK